jgi:hypothetical protein
MWNKQFEINFDLKTVIDNYSVSYIETSTHYILKTCPNCSGKNKLYVDKKEKFWVCFKCVKTNDFTVKTGRGNLQSFLSLIGLSPMEIKQVLKDGELKQYTDEDMFTSPKAEESKFKDPDELYLPDHFEPLDGTIHSVRRHLEAYRYLASRHVTDMSVIRSHDLRYSEPMKRVIFPVYQNSYKLVGWQGRDITARWKQEQFKCTNFECDTGNKWYFVGEEAIPQKCPTCGLSLEACHYPKSRNSKNFPKVELFYNQHNIDWSQRVVIVEGPFDSINTTNSIALLGKVLSSQQLNILISNAKDIVLYLDGDEAGWFSTEQLIYTLQPIFDSLKVCPCPPGLDPGSNTREGNDHYIRDRSIAPDDWLRSSRL